MPSYCCKHPHCQAYLPAPGYCEQHKKQGRKANRFYDEHLRNRDSKKFYNSKEWLLARKMHLAMYPICERCQEVFARHVHHVVPLKVATQAEKLDQRLLMSVCVECHNALTAEERKAV